MRTQLQVIRNLNAIRQRSYDGKMTIHDELNYQMLIDELSTIRGEPIEPFNQETKHGTPEDKAKMVLIRAMQRVIRLEMKQLVDYTKDEIFVYDELMEDLELFLFGGPIY